MFLLLPLPESCRPIVGARDVGSQDVGGGGGGGSREMIGLEEGVHGFNGVVSFVSWLGVLKLSNWCKYFLRNL